MRLYLINPTNPLVSIVRVKESRWNRYRVWQPLSLMVLAGLTPPEWDVTLIDENVGTPHSPEAAPPDLGGITAFPPPRPPEARGGRRPRRDGRGPAGPPRPADRRLRLRGDSDDPRLSDELHVLQRHGLQRRPLPAALPPGGRPR